jgi:hypothetical protein
MKKWFKKCSFDAFLRVIIKKWSEKPIFDSQMDRKIEFLDHLRSLKPDFDPQMDRKIEFSDHL